MKKAALLQRCQLVDAAHDEHGGRDPSTPRLARDEFVHHAKEEVGGQRTRPRRGDTAHEQRSRHHRRPPVPGIACTYREATGATDGSIIAVIISAHIPTKAHSARPIVPVPFPISRLTAMTASHAIQPAAPEPPLRETRHLAGSRSRVSAVLDPPPGWRRMLRSCRPGTRRGEPTRPRAVQLDAERGDTTSRCLAHGQRCVCGGEDIGESDGAGKVGQPDVVDFHVDDISEPNVVVCAAVGVFGRTKSMPRMSPINGPSIAGNPPS